MLSYFRLFFAYSVFILTLEVFLHPFLIRRVPKSWSQAAGSCFLASTARRLGRDSFAESLHLLQVYNGGATVESHLGVILILV